MVFYLVSLLIISIRRDVCIYIRFRLYTYLDIYMSVVLDFPHVYTYVLHGHNFLDAVFDYRAYFYYGLQCLIP